MPQFRHVIFDLDGLLTDTEPVHHRAFNLVMQAAGAEVQFDQPEYGRVMTGRSVLENAEYARERFALAADAQDIANAHHALFNLLISDAANVEPMPGAHEVLNFLKEHKIGMAVASGSRPEQVEKMLRAVNLASTFPVVVGGDDHIKPKPAPDIYLKALSITGWEPEATLAVEDSHTGVRAAHGAKLFVIAVKNEYTVLHDLGEANLVVASLNEVKDYLSRDQ